MKKEYLIFDLDGTLVESMTNAINVITDYLIKIPNTDLEKVKYVFSTTPGMALKNQIKLIYEGIPGIDIEKITISIYETLLKHDEEFFEGVPEKIHELSKNYKLFLTTGNSTKVALKYLEKGGIKELFELIYGSDKILKGNEHLNIFKEYSNDKNFFNKSFYIGDGHSDRMFAKEAGIDFIHIGNSKIDKFEILSVANINNILNLNN